ncbi:MAG: toprim domain-containing protein, partial [Burkholderiaceae bacterium]|nr:toprim domain-containing protein [Burkholderiaceae bacterium]
WLGEGGMAVADARKALNGSVGAERDMASAAFLQTVEDVLEVDLHPDWTGEVSILGEVVSPVDGAIVLAPPGVEPISWKVVATNADGSTNTVDYAESEDDARDMAGTLKLIDAYAETNEYEKAAKLARIYEESVQHNPESTREDIAVARAIRKDAEFNATRNDADLQRRISEQEKALTQTATELSDQANRVYIQVPYSEKDQAKALGARWDRQEQSWYVPPGADLASFSKYAQQAAKSGRDGENGQGGEGSEGREVDAPARQYLAVPYAERHQAKAAGAEWDKGAQCWYAGQAADMSRLSKWKSDQFQGQQDPAMQPKEEFAQALRQAGCVLSGEHPVMDGKKHRITVEGEKFSEHSGSGFYVGHLDGHPAGYIKNNKTGVETHWKSKGYTLDPQQKAELRASAALKLQERGDQLASQQAQIAERVTRQMADLVPVERPTAYMRAKGLQPQPGVMTDRGGETTYVPAYDADGKQWSTQYIRDDGAKRFAKGSRKTGCFHPVGGMEALAKAPALVIAEGYATACSLAESLKHATVAAFDSGNLPLVAQALHAKFPGKPVVIAGDNDLAQQAARGHNPGREKAQEAAQLTGGKLVLPIFAPDEQAKHAANFTDFNDLATKSALGRDGLDRQIRTAVAAEIERHEKKTQELTQELQQGHGQRRSIKVA